MNIREIRQKEAIDSYKGGSGLIKAAPRFGKTRVGIGIFRKFDFGKILIVAPRNEVLGSWKNEFKELKYNNNQVAIYL